MKDWISRALKSFRLYAITDLPRTTRRASTELSRMSPICENEDGKTQFSGRVLSQSHTCEGVVRGFKTRDFKIVRQIERALRGGVDIIQLRSKCLSDLELFEIGKEIRRVTRKLKKIFIVNDRVDLMLALDADGVHLGQDDLPIGIARKIIGKQSKIIGRSTHSFSQARQAEKEGADYIGYGPIFGTPTKPDYQPVGLESIRKVVESVHVPVVCIGGINQNNVEQVVSAGANRIAVVRAIFSASDPYEAAKNLKFAIIN